LTALNRELFFDENEFVTAAPVKPRFHAGWFGRAKLSGNAAKVPTEIAEEAAVASIGDVDDADDTGDLIESIEPVAYRGDGDLIESIEADGTGDLIGNSEPIETIETVESIDSVEPIESFETFETIETVETVKPPSRVRKVFKILFFVCIIFLSGELAWLFLVTPMRPFSTVTVAGIDTGSLDRNEVLRVAGIGAGASYLSLDAKAAERNLGAVPVIESAKVVKFFPGSVQVSVVPRKSVALFLQSGGDKTVPVYFDKQGVVFKIGGAKNAFLSVPVISGLETDQIAEGSRLASAYIPLFENLSKLAAAAPGLYQAISEIHINKKTYDGFDVTLFPSHSPVKVRINAELDEETIGHIFLLVDALLAKGEDVSEIDFRTGTASYMVKGASGN
jgi:cell division protein FtsQ